MPEEQAKPNTIFGMTPEQLQEFLARIFKKIPFLKNATKGVEASRQRMEGKKPYPGLEEE